MLRSKRAAAAVAENKIRENIEDFNLPENASFKKQRKIDETEKHKQNGNSSIDKRRSCDANIAVVNSNGRRSSHGPSPESTIDIENPSIGIDSGASDLTGTMSISSIGSSLSLPRSDPLINTSNHSSVGTSLLGRNPSNVKSSAVKAQSAHQRRLAASQVNNSLRTSIRKPHRRSAASPIYSPIIATYLSFSPVAHLPTTPIPTVLSLSGRKKRTT